MASFASGPIFLGAATVVARIPAFCRSTASDLFSSVLLPTSRKYGVMECMSRRLRIQYSGAIYHIMARGNGRQEIVRDDDDRDRLQEHLGRAAIRCGWRVYAFVIMSNHIHVVLKTPQPNLARGMQALLSAYANGWSRRHRFGGHVFQGRYRAELVEDESYLWTVTRYLHLNPVRARMVENPAAWAWSSYPGYAHRGRRLEWVAYDEVLASWAGGFGGSDPAGAYRRYVNAGLSEPPESPWAEAHHGWILGSRAFLDRVRAMVRGEPPRERRRESRMIQGHPLSHVSEVVCGFYGIDRAELSRRGTRHPARAALAYVARRRTVATNAELARVLGLSRPESVPNLTRRFAAWLATSREVRKQLRCLEEQMDRSGSPKQACK
jgi:REP element-mobilizing transposase RayT